MSFLSNHLTLRHAPSGTVLRLEPRAALRACSHQATAREPTPQEKATAATTLPGRPAGSHPAIAAAQAAAAGSKHPGAAAAAAPRAGAGVGAGSAPRLQVSAASKWTPKEGELSQFTVQQIDFGHDWTYTTLYKGDVMQEQNVDQAGPIPPAAGDAAPTTLVPAPSRVSPTTDEIKVEMLQRPDQILWYDSLPLFEDELHDNGVASLVVKVRVMPGCFLVLCQFWLRVDAVLMRVYDTRIFHEFGTDHLIREQTCREDSFDELAKVNSRQTWTSEDQEAPIVLISHTLFAYCSLAALCVRVVSVACLARRLCTPIRPWYRASSRSRQWRERRSALQPWTMQRRQTPLHHRAQLQPQRRRMHDRKLSSRHHKQSVHF